MTQARPAGGEPTDRSTTPAEAVRLDGVTKHFFGEAANDAVDLVVQYGHVHALLGENGAGKSTACSIMAGLYQPDGGTLRVDGVERRFGSPADALSAGVGMVYQHFRLVEELTVAENIVLGHPDVPARLRRRWLTETCRRVATEFGLTLEPMATVGDLAVGQQQQVEIARLLFRGVRTLVLDEPTAVLTPQEARTLFDNVRRLVDDGHAIVIVTHKLDEVLAVADTVTVMRHGRVVAHGPAAAHTPQSLAHAMVGRDVDTIGSVLPTRPPSGPDGRAIPASTVLAVDHLTIAGASSRVAVDDVSLTVADGEIVGVCGVSGNGQRELAEGLLGIRRARAGSIRMRGREIGHATVAARIAAGMSYVPEDRLATGVAPGLTVEDNLILRTYRDGALRHGLLLDRDAARAEANALIGEYDVRGVRAGLPISMLSGGNIQRVILAREISRRPSLLVAASPTRGLDIAATAAVRELLRDARAGGLAILLISEDLDELFALSDRLVVMYRGRLVGSFTNGHVTTEELGRLMAGVTSTGAPA